jgi:hypothetical protein
MAHKRQRKARFTLGSIMAWALVFLGTFLPMEEIAAGPTEVDLELVLAVDVSGSMSKAELLIQRQGYIAALRSDEVGASIAFRGGVALAYMEWAGPDQQRIVVPWTVVSDTANAEQFAEMLAAAPLQAGFGSAPWETGTSISRALLFAADMFSRGGASHTIDISGNGPNNSGDPLAPVREFVVARGIAINGLPIMGPDLPASAFPLTVYYEDCVIGGPGALAVTVDHPARLASAVRRKLLLEIAAMPPQFTLVGFEPASEPRIDCALSETGH